MMLGSKIIARTLQELGVRRIYVYPGGTIAPLLDELVSAGIEYVCPRHEQGAGYAALGAAKATGETQVVLVTSGPGATNLLTPVADAYYDSVPLLVITGQVGAASVNREKKLRQTGFQEADTVGIYASVTKSAETLYGEDDLSRKVMDAFALTRSGRPGPVLLDLPIDVQRADFKGARVRRPARRRAAAGASRKTLTASARKLADELRQAERPVILAGNGLYLSQCVPRFRRVVRRLGVPVVSSFPGVGVMPSRSRQYFGFLGFVGEFHANLAVHHADLVVVLGARLDFRQTGTETDRFAPRARLFRVDIDPAELRHSRVPCHENVHADVGAFLEVFEDMAEPVRIDAWRRLLNGWRRTYDSSRFYDCEREDISSYDIITAVDRATRGRRVVVTTGVGIHQPLTGRYFSFDHPRRRWFTSAGHGAMGYDLPVAMGALLALPDDYTGIVFAGDGSVQMNIQELASIHDLRLRLKIIVLDNKRLGLVSQFQIQNWHSDPTTGSKEHVPFSHVGKAFGLLGYDITRRKDITPIMDEVFALDHPAIVHCQISDEEDIYPMLLNNTPNNAMDPFGIVEAPA